MRLIKIIPILLTISLVLVGCKHSISPSHLELSKYQAYENQEVTSNENTDHLKLWTHEISYDIENTIRIFNQAYPNIKVEVTVINRDEVVDKYRESLIEKDTPDLFVISDENLGSFSGINRLENLKEKSDDPFFLELFKSGLIQNYSSVHEDYVYALPFEVYPYVTFYRADILEKEGFPSEPTELAEYMKNEENFMRMATELETEDHYIMEYSHSLITHFNRSINYHDQQLNYLGADSSSQKVFEVSEFIGENELFLNNTIWSPEGKQALKDDRLVMFFLPSYGQDRLKEWLPEQYGKWRATNLPFGKVGMDKEVGKSLAISSYSDNKELAWKFVEFAAKNNSQRYNPTNGDYYFGGQDLNSLYKDIISTDLPGQPTPIDKSAYEVWELYLYKLNSSNHSISKSDVLKIESNINERVRLDKRVLLDLIDQ
ncbi:extracellular solute-binding protein [Aquibacillus halophilus]|uniref:Extracellular solute-binding protein n=1 Tax=Aquibacillus halophilus TaxID=930132 RepID=A0A6A8DKC7_9BACI|nr:extracellular solute-binding protein [Aquibacillus halophilus]MRH41702.1 extracellular solute-binding protein [Aquibacillus halophilus]